MRSEQSIMYKTPKRNGHANGDSVKNELRLRNLSSVRQHLFSRDSFTNKSSIDLSAQSLDLTGRKIHFSNQNYLKFYYY